MEVCWLSRPAGGDSAWGTGWCLLTPHPVLVMSWISSASESAAPGDQVFWILLGSLLYSGNQRGGGVVGGLVCWSFCATSGDVRWSWPIRWWFAFISDPAVTCWPVSWCTPGVLLVLLGVVDLDFCWAPALVLPHSLSVKSLPLVCWSSSWWYM